MNEGPKRASFENIKDFLVKINKKYPLAMETYIAQIMNRHQSLFFLKEFYHADDFLFESMVACVVPGITKLFKAYNPKYLDRYFRVMMKLPFKP